MPRDEEPDMPLTPETRGLLDFLAQANLPRYPAVGALEARRIFRERGRLLQPDPPPVASAQDRAVPGPHGSIPVRVYRPVGSSDDVVLPVLVFFHGGGWVIGDVEGYDTLCRALANESRCAVVSVNYRLAPEHKFPSAVEDCVAATSWVAEHAPELRVDRERLAVGGDSAGGNLAAVVSITARDAGAPAIAFQLLIYPATRNDETVPSRVELRNGYLLEQDLIDWFGECYVRTPADYADWRCSPFRAPDLSRLPPALVLTAEYDPLRDEGKDYADRLRAAGVKVTYRCHAGMIHGFVNMGRVIPQASAAIRECAEAMANALR
jgi:acetyl esterase